MNTEEVTRIMKEFQVLEQSSREERDFEILIFVYDQYRERINTVGNKAKRTAQIAYCHARKGRTDEAKKELKTLESLSFGMGDDEYYRVVTLLSFFITNDAENLNVMQVNTIRNWLQEPEASQQVREIVFDYIDYI